MPRSIRTDIEFGLSDVHDPFQRSNRNGLPLLGMQGASQQFQIRFVMGKKAGEEMAVEPFQVLHGVAHAETRVQVKKQVRVSERAREIEQHGATFWQRCRVGRPDLPPPSSFRRLPSIPSGRSVFQTRVSVGGFR